MSWFKKVLLVILVGWSVEVAAIFWSMNTDLESDRLVITFGGLFVGGVIVTIGMLRIPSKPS